MKLIAKESQLIELMTARLMGNYIFFSEHTPLQTQQALYKVWDQEGTFYSIGNDVNALFFKPSMGSTTPDPSDSLSAWLDHLTMTGRRLPMGYTAALEAFCQTLETRKEGLDGAWFNLEGEKPNEAFMRRLKKHDPSYTIFRAYNDEFVERWKNAEVVPKEKVLDLMKDVERRYLLECESYEAVAVGLSEELGQQSRADIEELQTLSEVGELEAHVKANKVVSLSDGVGTSLTEQLKASDAVRDKAVDVVMALRNPGLDKK